MNNQVNSAYFSRILIVFSSNISPAHAQIDYQRVILTTKTEENSIIFSLKGKNIIFRKKNVTGTYKNVTGNLSNLSKIFTATFSMSRPQI